MPSCCHCGAEVRQGFLDPANPIFPLRCAACGTEQHRADMRWPFLVGGPVLATLVAIAAFVLLVAWGIVAAVALLVLFVVATFAWEARARRRFRMLATSPGEKRAYRLAFAAVLVVAGAYIGTQELAKFRAQAPTAAGEPR
jgi:hypothetical protein